jgi:dynein heavy chain
MKLHELLEFKADEFEGEISDISGTAQGEEKIEKQLAEVVERWSKLEFSIMPYRDFKDKFLITEVDDLIMALEDDAMAVGAMMGNKNVTEIRDEVEDMEQKLKYIDIVVAEWTTFQRSWMYLENIFSADDIREQLKDETRMFMLVDKFWREHMIRCNKDRIVINFVDGGGLRKKFEDNNKRLDEIKQKLEDYLTTKRAAFPRFFFLTNDELIQILSQTRNPQAVQPYLNKCFDAIKRCKFTTEKNSTEITSMISPEGEVVDFTESAFARGPVESWLNGIQQTMFTSLYLISKKALETYPTNGAVRDDWLFETAAQTILVIDQIQWTCGVEEAIYEIMGGKNRGALVDFEKFSNDQL